MSDTALIHFRANLSGSAVGLVGPKPGTVVLTPEALLLTVDDREKRRRLPFAAIFDFVIRLPDGHRDGGTRQMSLSVRRFEERQMVTVEAATATIAEFRERLVSQVFDDATVRVTHPYRVDGEQTDAEPCDATLRIGRDGLRFESSKGKLLADYADVEYVTKSDTAADPEDETGRNAYLVRDVDGKAVNTAVSAPSTSACNLLVRHLRAATRATGDDAGVSVLVVDDEPGMAELVSLQLESLRGDLSATWATSPLRGLDALHERDVDVVVSDYAMPEMNGIEFLKTVRRQYPDQPFVLFTGKGSESVAAEAIGEGVTDYVTKSIAADSYQHLLRRVERAAGAGE